MKTVTECSILWEGEQTAAEIGTLKAANGHIYFAYSESWLRRGLEISPLYLPTELGTKPVSMTDPRAEGYTPNSALTKEFRGLPAPFYDSLPDSWGMKLLESYTKDSADNLDAITILCHRGRRCMGAFSYHPATSSSRPHPCGEAELDLYCREAGRLAREPRHIKDVILLALEESGGSAGGMRPKILLALPDSPSTELAIRSLEGFDHKDLPEGYTPWLLKFDTEPEKERGKIEHAFANLAKGCGLNVPPTQIVRTKGPDGVERAHFAVQRFDRTKLDGTWLRVHMHTAAGLLRRNFNELDLDYTDLLELTKQLTGTPKQVEESFRRAVFNVLAGNADDHAKNHAFLMNQSGQWALSPAYDLTPSRLRQTPGIRSTSVLGIKDEKAAAKALHHLGERHEIPKDKVQNIIEEVKQGLSRWRRTAGEAGISQNNTAKVQERLDEVCPSPTAKKPIQTAIPQDGTKRPHKPADHGMTIEDH